jgi:hypothetical protein
VTGGGSGNAMRVETTGQARGNGPFLGTRTNAQESLCIELKSLKNGNVPSAVSAPPQNGTTGKRRGSLLLTELTIVRGTTFFHFETFSVRSANAKPQSESRVTH